MLSRLLVIGRDALLAALATAATTARCTWSLDDDVTGAQYQPAAPTCTPPPGCFGWALLVLPECHQCWDGEWPEPEPEPPPSPVTPVEGLEILSPSADEVVTASSIIVSGRVGSAAGVAGVTWRNDLTWLSGEAQIGAWESGGSPWTATVSLAWGQNPIRFTALFADGSTAEASIVIVRDAEPPTVAIVAPTTAADFTTPDAPIRLRIDARDDAGLATATWWNEATGVASSLVDNTWGLVPVRRGANRIVVTVTDVAGRTATDEVTVTCTAELQEWRPSWSAPVTVGGLVGVRAVADGDRHIVALGGDGRVWQRGELPDGTWSDGLVVIAGVDRVVAVAAGFRHTLAIDEDGVVWSWGRYGQEADGIPFGSDAPIAVPLPAPATAVAAGYGFGLAALADGTVRGWGDNRLGQLGDGTMTSRSEPVQVTGLDGVRVTSLATAYGHALAVSDDGRWWAWGWGRGFAGITRLTAAPIEGAPGGIVEVAAGLHFSLALDAGGSVWAIGENDRGQLGDGTQIDRALPVQVANLAGAVAITAAPDNGVALLADGQVHAWGWFVTAIQTRPQPVPGLDDVIALGPRGSLFLSPPLP